MKDNKVTIGIDFGSASVRVLTLELKTGNVLTSVVQPYSKGENGVFLNPQNHNLARQSATDFVHSMEVALQKAKVENEKQGIKMQSVVGIGVDATGSTPLPITQNLQPLSELLQFKENLNAYAWMWKDHTAHKEAQAITELIKKIRPQYLEKIGGAYSSEWFWAKILHCRNIDKNVFDNAYTWVEFSDFIPAVLAGVTEASKLKRNTCAAGHKGLYNEDWGGFPELEFVNILHPDLVKISKTLPQNAFSIEQTSGALCAEWAVKTGMQEGVPIAMGILDAHAGAIGSGIKKGSLVKIIGTSTCDLVLADLQSRNSNIKGVASVAKESVLPNYIGIEAGQAAVGDVLNWYVNNVLNNSKTHQELTLKAEKLIAGESGLLALDWNNGNRSILADPTLSGLIVGQSLQTKDFEIYRALIEATAFGAKVIIEDMERQGVVINEVVNCGGITHKNALFMQIYADIINKPMKVAATDETVALGAALMGSYIAYKAEGKTVSYNKLQAQSCSIKEHVFKPNSTNVNIYNKLYKLYLKLHDAFGKEGETVNMFNIMKKLIALKKY